MAEKAELESHNFLRAYCSAHQESAKFFEPEQFLRDGSPPDLVSWLKRMNALDEGITFSQANKRKKSERFPIEGNNRNVTV